MQYVNVGAPIRRANGEIIRRNEVFEPTEDERIRKAYKLRPVGDGGRTRHTPPAAVAETPRTAELEDYHTGYGWYVIDGKKIQGKENALAALRAMDGTDE